MDFKNNKQNIDTVGQERNNRGTPERNLLMCILERAILDYVGNNKKEIERASDWIFTNSNTDHKKPYSFIWLCSELDLNYKKIAKVIREMPKRGTNRVAPWYTLKKEASLCS